MKAAFFLCAAVAVAAHTAWAEVYVQNDRMYLGEDGSLHIVGEVYNGLDAPVGQVNIGALVSDERGAAVATGAGWSLVNTIMPGMMGPFDIVITDGDLQSSHTYATTIDYAVRPPKSQAIDVTSASLERSSQGDLFITGTVANLGHSTANMVSVVATIYDRDGNVATTARTQPEPDYLRSDHEWVFVVPIPERDQVREMVGYALVAESEEYAAVPEFPLGSTVVLAVSAAGYVLLTRNSPIACRPA